jgi:Zn-dependent oligopeptidase
MDNMNNDLFRMIGSIISNEIPDDVEQEMIDHVANTIDGMNETELTLNEAARFFTQQAIAHNEPRLFHAAYACLALSGLLSPIMEQIGTPQALMDLADHSWEDSQTLIEQAIAKMVWGDDEPSL